jgi:hypothetical protein
VLNDGVGKASRLTFRARPSTEVPSESDANDLWTLQLPGHASHGVDRISSANSDAQHTHASSVWRVRVCANDQSTRASRS